MSQKDAQQSRFEELRKQRDVAYKRAMNTNRREHVIDHDALAARDHAEKAMMRQPAWEPWASRNQEAAAEIETRHSVPSDRIDRAEAAMSPREREAEKSFQETKNLRDLALKKLQVFEAKYGVQDSAARHAVAYNERQMTEHPGWASWSERNQEASQEVAQRVADRERESANAAEPSKEAERGRDKGGEYEP